MKCTVKQLSILLKVDEEQIRRWIRSGKLIATLHSKKEGYVIGQEDLDKFMNSYGVKYKDRITNENLGIEYLASTHKSIAVITTLERLFKLRRQLATIQQEIDIELTYLHNLLEKDS